MQPGFINTILNSIQQKLFSPQIQFEFYTVLDISLSTAVGFFFRNNVCIIWDSPSKAILKGELPINREIDQYRNTLLPFFLTFQILRGKSEFDPS